jgi:hypothetical protein
LPFSISFPFSVCLITEAWRHGDIEMETWKYGDIDMDMEKWRHGDMDMETWRHGHGDNGIKIIKNGRPGDFS